MKPKSKKRYRTLNPATVLLVRQLLIGFGLLVSVGLILAAVWHATRLPAFTLKEINASGGATIKPVAVEEAARAALSGTYLKLIPKSFIYLYPDAEVRDAVNAVERIKDVHLDRQATTLYITYDEYIPDALWCAEGEGGSCLFLDETGYAFGRAPTLSGGSLLRYQALQSVPTVAARPLDEVDYHMTKKFAALLSETGWYVETIEVDAVRDVFYGLVGGAELKATLKEPVERTVSFLNTIRQSEQFNHLQPDNFSYIDLRFGTKVFVNETLESELGTTTATATEMLVEIEEVASEEVGETGE